MAEQTPIPFVDLVAMQRQSHDALRQAFDRVLQHGRYVLGPEVEAFEQQLSGYTGACCAVGVSSGTDALLATFLALDYAPGDEVLTTPFTFISTATSILRAGLRPVFVDVAEDGLHPDAASLEAAIGPRTRAILVVHLFGAPLDLGAIRQLCDERGLDLVEDCAQAIGARGADGKHVGTTGHVGTFSFFPAKNLGALGDGGAVITHDQALAARVRSIRQHGCVVKYRHDRLGGNFRLDALQAALLQVLLPRLDGWVEQRRANAQRYDTLFAAANIPQLTTPAAVPGHTYNQYVIQSPRRDRLQQALTAANIGCAVYYPSPLHVQPALAAANPPASLPVAERLCRQVLALPIAPGLREDQARRVVECLAAVAG